MPSNRKPLVRSSSQDNSSSQVSEQGGEDYFRLPPILAPFLEQSAPAGGKGAGEGEASVTSGVGTHADSSVSSGFSSENEDQMNLEKEMEKQSTLVASGSANSTPEKETDRPDGVVAAPGRALDVVEDPSSSGDPVAPRDLPVPEENGAPPREKLKLPGASDDCQPPISMADPCPPPDLDANLDKLSTLSTVSTKSATESVITNASSNSPSARNRSASGAGTVAHHHHHRHKREQ